MIKAKAKTTETKKYDIAALLDRLQKGSVTVGVQDDAGYYETSSGGQGPLVAEVALWNEFGTSTSPERSFLRSAIDDNASELNAYREELLANIIFKGWTIEKALEALGIRIQFLIQNKIKSNIPPPLSASTIASKKRKGVAPVTLIDSGLMLRSITYKVNLE